MAKRKVCESTEISPKVAKSPPKRNGQSVQSLYQNELKRLQRLTKDVIPDDKRVELMGESIFTEYDNGGGQSGLREHPGFSAYNKLFTTFSRGIKQITDMMPSGSTSADALMDYLNETRFGG